MNKNNGDLKLAKAISQGFNCVFITQHAVESFEERFRFNGLPLRRISFDDLRKALRLVKRWTYDPIRKAFRGHGEKGELFILSNNAKTLKTVLREEWQTDRFAA